MKSNDQKRALFDAVTGLEDDLITEAAAPKIRAFPKRMLRIAAAAAAVAILLTALSFWPNEGEIITGPGLLTVKAYGVNHDDTIPAEGVVLEEGVEFTSNVIYNPYISYRQHFPISFFVDENHYSGMEITLKVNTNAGIFYKNESFNPSHLHMSYPEQTLANFYGQHFVVGIDKKLYWQPSGFDYEHLEELVENGDSDPLNHVRPYYFMQNPSFIDVIIRADGNIVGYCVIEIREINGKTGLTLMEFQFRLLAMVSFPQVDGKWQTITEEYVHSQFNKIHLEREELT